MRLILRYKLEIISLLVTIFIFFALRIPNLTMQPIFADEAIYIRWAQVMRAEPTLRFLPVSDGKTPLFMWSMMPLLKISSDPLFAGRILSVFSGLFTLFGVFAVSWMVFGRKIAVWSSLFYALVPYSVFFDRMALVDSMLGAFCIWALFFAILVVRFLRLDLAMILGYILGGAILVKTPGMINLFILPLTILGFDFKDKRKLIRLFLVWLVAIVIALIIYNILRLGPNFNFLASRNSDYIFSPAELLQRPLDPFIPHLRDIIDWFPKLLTWPILILVLAGITNLIYQVFKKPLAKDLRIKSLLLLWALIPILIQMSILKTFTARYLLFSIPPLLIFASYGIETISQIVKKLKLPVAAINILLLIVAVTPAVYFDLLLLTDPAKAPLPQEERRGYFEDWTAGFGFSEIAKFLIEKKKNGPVVVGTEGYFGTLPDGLQIYLDKSGIAVVGSEPAISAKIRDATRINQTFFVANKQRVGEHLENAKLIMTFPKLKPLDNREQDAIVLYQVFK